MASRPGCSPARSEGGEEAGRSSPGGGVEDADASHGAEVEVARGERRSSLEASALGETVVADVPGEADVEGLEGEERVGGCGTGGDRGARGGGDGGQRTEADSPVAEREGPT